MSLQIKELYEKHAAELMNLSITYKVPIPTILAVLQVETNDDDGFDDKTKRLIIRFEAHKFIKYCGTSVKHIARSMFRYNKDKPWKDQQFRALNVDTFKSYHGNQNKEHDVFIFCIEVDELAAFKSISMGLPQIMGFNYLRLEFTTPMEMYYNFNLGVVNQIEGMFKFMDYSMLYGLRSRNFEAFARGYNGSGQAVRYGSMIGIAEREIAAWFES